MLTKGDVVTSPLLTWPTSSLISSSWTCAWPTAKSMATEIIFEDDSTIISRLTQSWEDFKEWFAFRPSGSAAHVHAHQLFITWAQFKELITTRNLLLCLPSFSLFTVLIFVIVTSVPFYGSLGVNSDLLLVFVALSRAIEAVLDPFVAQFYETMKTDDTNGQILARRGCLIGTLATGIFVGLHLSPPSSVTSTTGLVAWFAFTYLGLFFSMSLAQFPVASMICEAFPYEGSKDQYKRTILALTGDLLQNTALALTFMLSGYSSAAKTADSETDGVYDSCYSASGVGKSCLVLPDTGEYVTYNLFDPVKWASEDDYSCKYTSRGEVINDPQTLYTPKNCLASDATTYNGDCLAQYCQCIGQCTNLVNLDARRTYMSGAGWLLGCTLIVTVGLLLVHTHGWQALFQTLQHTPRAVVVEGPIGADAGRIASRSRLPNEAIVPKLVRIFRNKVVRSFLIPWLLDSMTYMMVLGTLAYYIRAVIKPEYDVAPVDCNAATPIFGTESALWRCQNRAVTSLLLALIALAAILSAVFWYTFSRLIGIVRAWQVGSLFSALCILTLVFSASHGETTKAIGLGMLMGVGFGSRFLTEVVLIEVIHYYEFISGYQYQHTFAMFKVQFLKMAVIFMQLLPVAIFYEVDFDPNPAMYKKPAVAIHVEKSLAQVVTVAIPCILSVAAFLAKMQFRLVDDDQFDLTAEGIRNVRELTEKAAQAAPTATQSSLAGTRATVAAHSPAILAGESPTAAKMRKTVDRPSVKFADQHQPASTAAAGAAPGTGAGAGAGAAAAKEEPVLGIDPTSGIHYPAVLPSAEDVTVAQLFAHFPDTQNTIDYHSCAQSQSPQIGVDLLINRTRDIAATTFILTVGLAVGMVFASDLLHQQDGYLFIPLFMIIMMGWAALACYFSVLALQAAILLQDPRHQPSVESLDRIIANLDALADIALVNLPTREVLRRIRETQDADAAKREGDATATTTSTDGAAAMADTTSTRKRSGDHDRRPSREVRERLAAEAFKQSIPTKEMEVVEWEQALFRAAKRALTRSKVPSQRVLHLVKQLQRSCRFNPGKGGLTKWEVEFYNHIAAQHGLLPSPSKSLAPTDEDDEGKSDDSGLSDATAESSGSEAFRRDSVATVGSGLGDVSRKGSAGVVVNVQPGRSASISRPGRSNSTSARGIASGRGQSTSGGVHGTVHAHYTSTTGGGEGAEEDEDSVGFDVSSEDPEDSEGEDWGSQSSVGRSQQQSASSGVGGMDGTHPHSASSQPGEVGSDEGFDSADFDDEDEDVVYSLGSSEHEDGDGDEEVADNYDEDQLDGAGSDGESGSVEYSLSSDEAT